MDKQSLELLLDQGLSIERIARRFGKDPSTVSYWMKKHGLMRRYGLRTQNGVGTRRPGVASAARDARMLSTTITCPRHGETEFVIEGRGYYRCERCRAECVVRHRQRVKAMLVEEAGGRCVICGYARHVQALQLHHADPSDKRLALSGQGATYSLARLRAEAKKCVLLCANCHVEVEIGAATVPATVSA